MAAPLLLRYDTRQYPLAALVARAVGSALLTLHTRGPRYAPLLPGIDDERTVFHQWLRSAETEGPVRECLTALTAALVGAQYPQGFTLRGARRWCVHLPGNSAIPAPLVVPDRPAGLWRWWLPLVDTAHTAALHLGAPDATAGLSPWPVRYGEALGFDPACPHVLPVNREGATAVALLFDTVPAESAPPGSAPRDP
jgi:hypothetical protein